MTAYGTILSPTAKATSPNATNELSFILPDGRAETMKRTNCSRREGSRGADDDAEEEVEEAEGEEEDESADEEKENESDKDKAEVEEAGAAGEADGVGGSIEEGLLSFIWVKEEEGIEEKKKRRRNNRESRPVDFF